MGVVSLFKRFHAIKYFEKVLTEAEKYATIIVLTQRKYFNEKVFLISSLFNAYDGRIQRM